MRRSAAIGQRLTAALGVRFGAREFSMRPRNATLVAVVEGQRNRDARHEGCLAPFLKPAHPALKRDIRHRIGPLQGDIRAPLRNHSIQPRKIRIVCEPSERIRRHWWPGFRTDIVKPHLARREIHAHGAHQHREIAQRSLSIAAGALGRDLGRSAGNFRTARLQKRFLAGFDAGPHGTQGFAGKTHAFLFDIGDARGSRRIGQSRYNLARKVEPRRLEIETGDTFVVTSEAKACRAFAAQLNTLRKSERRLCLVEAAIGAAATHIAEIFHCERRFGIGPQACLQTFSPHRLTRSISTSQRRREAQRRRHGLRGRRDDDGIGRRLSCRCPRNRDDDQHGRQAEEI
jgi:hypothetical protein